MTSKSRLFVVALLAAAAIGVGWYRTEVYQPSYPARHADPAEHANLVLITGGSSPYWQLLGKGALAAAEDMGAILELLIVEQDEDVQEQTKLLTSINRQTVDGVALSPLDAEIQTHLINELAKETLVITVDSDAPLSNRLSYVARATTPPACSALTWCERRSATGARWWCWSPT